MTSDRALGFRVLPHFAQCNIEVSPLLFGLEQYGKQFRSESLIVFYFIYLGSDLLSSLVVRKSHFFFKLVSCAHGSVFQCGFDS